MIGVRTVWLTIGVVALLVAVGTAQQRSETRSRNADDDAPARKFAKEHHPELLVILEKLQKSRRPEYNKAIRELNATCERLSKTKDRFPERYAMQLKEWKLDSRIRLLRARWTMADSDIVEQELGDLLRQRLENQLSQHESELSRLNERLEKMEKSARRLADSISTLKNDGDELIGKELGRFRREAESARITSTKRRKANIETTSAQKSGAVSPPTSK